MKLCTSHSCEHDVSQGLQGQQRALFPCSFVSLQHCLLYKSSKHVRVAPDRTCRVVDDRERDVGADVPASPGQPLVQQRNQRRQATQLPRGHAAQRRRLLRVHRLLQACQCEPEGRQTGVESWGAMIGLCASWVKKGF